MEAVTNLILFYLHLVKEDETPLEAVGSLFMWENPLPSETSVSRAEGQLGGAVGGSAERKHSKIFTAGFSHTALGPLPGGHRQSGLRATPRAMGCPWGLAAQARGGSTSYVPGGLQNVKLI